MRSRMLDSDRGQILVMVAAGLVVLIGVTALVVDLGMSWMLRRHEQNAADPGAVAAARYIPSGSYSDMVEAACFYARQNDFFERAPNNSSCTPGYDSQGAKLTVNWPPKGASAGQFAGDSNYVQVIVGRRHDSFFGRIFSQGDPWVSTGAVAANTIGNSNSSSLIALDPTCDNGPGGKISGTNATVEIAKAPGVTGEGGYVHVNSSCAQHPDGAPSVCTNGTTDLKIDSANLITPHAYVHGECTLNGTGANLSCAAPPCLTEGATQIGDPLESLVAPRIQEVAAFYGPAHCPNGTESRSTDTAGCDFRTSTCGADKICDLEPGVYYGGWNITQNGIQLRLQPGIYYLAGGGIRLNSGSIEAVSGDATTEARVMIYSTDHPTACPSNLAMCEGPIRMQANSSFAAKGLNQNTCDLQPITCPYRGILIWQEKRVQFPGSEVRLGGQNSSIVAGTIYAPRSLVTLNGGANGTGCGGANQACLSVQIIAWRFEITGGGYLKLPYDPSQLYQFAFKGLVH